MGVQRNSKGGGQTIGVTNIDKNDFFVKSFKNVPKGGEAKDRRPPTPLNRQTENGFAPKKVTSIQGSKTNCLDKFD